MIGGKNQNWLLNLNVIYETLDLGRKWLADFNAGKTQLVLFDQSNKTGAIDTKIDGSVLEEKLSCFFLLRLLCISIKLPYNHACDTVVTSGLVPLFTTWIWIC